MADEQMTTTSGKVFYVKRSDDGEIVEFVPESNAIMSLSENEVFDLYNYITETDEEDDD